MIQNKESILDALFLAKDGKKMVNIAICDDNEQQVRLMENIVCERYNNMNVPFKIVKCSNGGDLLQQMKDYGDFDLIFLDIELGVDNGIDTAEKIKENNPYCFIIFVSGYNQYYKEAFRVQPYDFIDKPVKKEEVERVIESVSKRIIDHEQVFSFEYRWTQYRIPLNDILYFVSEKRLISIYTKDGSIYEFYGRMNDVESQVNEMTNLFLRVHKSYLLNMNHIKIFQSDDVTMQNNQLFPISARKRSKVMEQYMEFVSM